MTVPRINEVEIRVSDPQAALRVYRDLLGVPLQEHAHDDAPAHFRTAWGEGESFLFFSIYPCAPGEETRTSLGFNVAGLTELHQRMQSTGLTVIQDIEERPWGARTALYEDAAGNRIWLSEDR